MHPGGRRAEVERGAQLCNNRAFFRGNCKIVIRHSGGLSTRVITRTFRSLIRKRDRTSVEINPAFPHERPRQNARERRGVILELLVRTSHPTTSSRDRVLGTVVGNYLGPVWNFPRRCSNYSEHSRDESIRTELGQVRRACHASRSSCPRGTRRSRVPEKENEKDRETDG